MKLVRFGDAGKEKPGFIDSQGNIRDISSLVSDISAETLSPESLASLRTLDPTEYRIVSGEERLGACVGDIGNFLGVGLNYADHAEECNASIPVEPLLFNKNPNCAVGARDDVVLPKNSVKTDWEVELAIVIGSEAYYVSESNALRAVAGYTICLDVSEREKQHGGTGQWVKGKGCPTFGPLGPYLVTADEIEDVGKLGMYLELNKERMQTGNTASMIFNVPYLISYISNHMRLEPGDVIATGTPAGVGARMTPPRFLRDGDQVELGIDQLGSHSHRVVSWRRS